MNFFLTIFTKFRVSHTGCCMGMGTMHIRWHYLYCLFILNYWSWKLLLSTIRCCVTNFFLLWCALDYIQCPYCQRRFNENAADRHINFCKEQAARISNKGKFSAEAKGKPASRPQVNAWVQLFLKTSENVLLCDS